jgi:hypothetical protein
MRINATFSDILVIFSLIGGGNRNTWRKPPDLFKSVLWQLSNIVGGRRGCDRIVVGFTPTCEISAYHH